MTDPYQTLGVAKDASAEDIRRAYRKLAKTHHPDLNPGSKAAEDLFKAVSAANDLLSDPEKRARFDRGEIDADGDPRPEHPAYRSQGARHGQSAGMESMFADLFAQSFERGQRPARGRDVGYTLAVDFVDAITGVQQRLGLPDGRSLDVRVPPGMEGGQTLRLRGQGNPGGNGGQAGDALITVTVRPHASFRRDGHDIHLDLPVTLKEAVLGGPGHHPDGHRLRRHDDPCPLRHRQGAAPARSRCAGPRRPPGGRPAGDAEGGAGRRRRRAGSLPAELGAGTGGRSAA